MNNDDDEGEGLQTLIKWYTDNMPHIAFYDEQLDEMVDNTIDDGVILSKVDNITYVNFRRNK